MSELVYRIKTANDLCPICKSHFIHLIHIIDETMIYKCGICKAESIKQMFD